MTADPAFPWRRGDDFGGGVRGRYVIDRGLIRDPRPPDPVLDPVSAPVDADEVDRIIRNIYR